MKKTSRPFIGSACGRLSILLVAALGAPTVGHAYSLIGDTVTFQCTNCFPPTNDSFVVMQGGGPELTLFDQFQIDVEAASLRVNWIFNSAGVIGDLRFVWSDLDPTDGPGQIVGVTIDPSSTWGQNAFMSFTADSVTLRNNNDSTVTNGDFWLAHLVVIPEPNSALLLCGGTALACFLRRRRPGR